MSPRRRGVCDLRRYLDHAPRTAQVRDMAVLQAWWLSAASRRRLKAFIDKAQVLALEDQRMAQLCNLAVYELLTGETDAATKGGA